MYKMAASPKVGKLLGKFKKTDRHLYNIIMNKMKEVLINPTRYKNLKAPLNHLRRVHIDTNFVLLFSVDEKMQMVTFVSYKHHDNAY